MDRQTSWHSFRANCLANKPVNGLEYTQSTDTPPLEALFCSYPRTSIAAFTSALQGQETNVRETDRPKRVVSTATEDKEHKRARIS